MAMNNSALICKPLTEIAEIERAQKNRIYPAGSIYVQVSACKKNTDEIWNELVEPGTIDGKFAVVIPKTGIIPHYLVIALEKATAEWHSRYIGTNINISMDAFKYLRVMYHEDIKAQLEVIETIRAVEQLMQQEKEIVNNLKESKRWFLQGMFAS